ncbi:MAG: hypothetical protein PWP68_1632 [Rikenellaceae bacterium]|nr:hypothetical protein [Rikenellaceae bacterium]
MNVYLGEKVDSSSYEIKYGTIDSFITIKYNMIAIILNFNLKLISDFTCSAPTDSVVGNIDYLTVVANYYYNNDTILDTISDIIKVRIKYLNNEEVLFNLDNISILQPRYNANIYLFLNSPTDTTCLQSFTIYYKETDGTIFSATTKPIYITP